jgi:hypothetical protein
MHIATQTLAKVDAGRLQSLFRLLPLTSMGSQSRTIRTPCSGNFSSGRGNNRWAGARIRPTIAKNGVVRARAQRWELPLTEGGRPRTLTALR